MTFIQPAGPNVVPAVVNAIGIRQAYLRRSAPRNVHVAAAASPRPVPVRSASQPRRRRELLLMSPGRRGRYRTAEPASIGFGQGYTCGGAHDPDPSRGVDAS